MSDIIIDSPEAAFIWARHKIEKLEAQVKAMQEQPKWEHAWFPTFEVIGFTKSRETPLKQLLAEIGEQGWEALQICFEGVWAKRRKVND